MEIIVQSDLALYLFFLQEVQVSGDFIVTTEGFQDVKSVSALNIADACRLQDSRPL